jgi:hypothetical protein
MKRKDIPALLVSAPPPAPRRIRNLMGPPGYRPVPGPPLLLRPAPPQGGGNFRLEPAVQSSALPVARRPQKLLWQAVAATSVLEAVPSPSRLARGRDRAAVRSDDWRNPRVPPVYHLIIHKTGHLSIENDIEKWAPAPTGQRREAGPLPKASLRRKKKGEYTASPGGPKPCLLCKLKAHRGFPRGKRNRAGGKLVWAPGN